MTTMIVDRADVGRVDQTQQLMIRARRMRAEAAGEMFRSIGRAGRRLAKRVKAHFDDLRVVREASRLDDRLLSDAGLNRATLRHDLKHGHGHVADIQGTVVTSGSVRANSSELPAAANASGNRQAA